MLATQRRQRRVGLRIAAGLCGHWANRPESQFQLKPTVSVALTFARSNTVGSKRKLSFAGLDKNRATRSILRVIRLPTYPHRQPAVARDGSEPNPLLDLRRRADGALMRHALAKKTRTLAALLGRRITFTDEGRWLHASHCLVCRTQAERQARSHNADLQLASLPDWPW